MPKTSGTPASAINAATVARPARQRRAGVMTAHRSARRTVIALNVQITRFEEADFLGYLTTEFE